VVFDVINSSYVVTVQFVSQNLLQAFIKQKRSDNVAPLHNQTCLRITTRDGAPKSHIDLQLVSSSGIHQAR